MLRARVAPFQGASQIRRRYTVQVANAKGFGSKPKVAPQPQKDQPAPDPCPCESGKAYKNCCGPIHSGTVVAATPEATLRARFSAFSKGEADYILNTTHPDYHLNHYQVATPGGAADKLREDVAAGCNKFAYTGLRIVAVEPGVNEYEGYVSFEYLSRKRSAPGAPMTQAELSDTASWNRTAEKCRFLRTGSETWQFVDYQTATFDTNMLSGLQQAPAEPKAAAS